MDDVALHGLVVGDPAPRHLAALQRAVPVLASGAAGHGHGQHRLILLVALIVVVVIVAVCIAYLLRSRRSGAGKGEAILAGTFAVFAVAGGGVMGGQLQAIGLGLALGVLLDTFGVRTLLVPSIVVLLGRWNWWPSRLT